MHLLFLPSVCRQGSATDAGHFDVPSFPTEYQTGYSKAESNIKARAWAMKIQRGERRMEYGVSIMKMPQAHFFSVDPQSRARWINT